ncbi:hypothetical protein BT96DRAFT_947348 [Gymnopus androsaceus JB14]|uniref:Uncharacterized protein n=1 Tax=Gymnopus androsaceus JB14 TaxID=1447944 RepID=A0A6A4GTP1_9AGAR|nr:hypothetical protein BT96DRAFT_947348 [Gymnopus androsaceus JB14]
MTPCKTLLQEFFKDFHIQDTDKDQPSKTHLGDLDVNSSDVECDSNFNSVASNPDPFDHLVNSGLQDPRNYEYDPDRYGPDSYKLLEDLPSTVKQEVSSATEHTHHDDCNTLIESNHKLTAKLEHVNACIDELEKLTKYLELTKKEWECMNTRIQMLEKELHSLTDIFNQLGVIFNSVSNGSFDTDGVLDTLNENLIHKFHEMQ